MKLNLLNEKINVRPEGFTEITRKELYTYMFKFNNIFQESKLTDSEISVFVTLLEGKELSESGISKTNIYKILKTLEDKGLIVGKELSKTSSSYKQFFDKEDKIEIMFNFKIKNDDTG